jgi:outer membrane protein OmpA-like peptidoglycan-associated protein
MSAGSKLQPSNMAEQAQRRASQEQSTENPPVDKSARDGHAPDNHAADNHAYEELRHLIVGPEQEGLKEVQERLDDPERRIEDVSSVVAEAIQMRREQGDDQALAEALAPTIQDTLRESVRRDPHVLADALFPVMGPAIRKSITETLRGMLESFNTALEHSLSWQGLKWRLEAFRTGRPFSEVAMMHSLLFRVEQVFLIHRETGLVLSHVVAPQVATQDPSLVSGMLSAIQQFVKDSFESQRGDNTLDFLEVGELEVWIEQGPGAVLAAVIRGHAPESYRFAMKEALENIQRHYSAALAHFEGDAAPFRPVEDDLTHLLEAQFKKAPEEGHRRPRAALIAGAVIVALIAIPVGYSIYLLWEWSRFLKVLRQEPGIVVLSYARDGGRYHVQGFRDPLAANPENLLASVGIDPKTANLELKPFYSFDDPIVLKRAKAFLHPPSGVTLSEKDGHLRAEGIATPAFIARFEERAPWIPGVTAVDDSHLQNSEQVELNRLRASLESTVLLFPIGRAELEPGQESSIASSQNNIRSLLVEAGRLNGKITIEVVGHTDITGVEGTNLVLSKQRADVVTSLLARSGIKPANLHGRGVGTSQPLHDESTEEGRRFNRSITFKVAFSPAPPVN